jgi:DNA-binding NarL/FixJ family response regulator
MKSTAMSETAKSFLQNAIETVVARKPFEFNGAERGPAAAHAPRSALTKRQLDVLELLCEGLTNKDIGKALEIGNATVKIHVSSILRTLNVTSRLQAAIVARRLGLVKDPACTDESGIANPHTRQPVVLRVVWDGASAQIIGIDKETVY